MALTAEKDLEKAIEKLLKERKRKEFKPTKTGAMLRVAGNIFNAPAYSWMGDKIDQYVRKKEKEKEKEEKEAALKASEKGDEQPQEKKPEAEKDKLLITILKIIESLQKDIGFIKERISPKFFDAKSSSTGELKRVMFDPLGPAGEQFRRAEEGGKFTSAMGKDLEKSAIGKVTSGVLKQYQQQTQEQFTKLEANQETIAAASGVDLNDPTTFVDPTEETDPISQLRKEMNENFEKVFKLLGDMSGKGGKEGGFLDTLDTLGDLGGLLAGGGSIMALLKKLSNPIMRSIPTILSRVLQIGRFLNVPLTIATGLAGGAYTLYRMLSGKQVSDAADKQNEMLSEYGIKVNSSGTMGSIESITFTESGKTIKRADIPPDIQTVINAASENGTGVFKKDVETVLNNPGIYSPDAIRARNEQLYTAITPSAQPQNAAEFKRQREEAYAQMNPAQQMEFAKKQEQYQREYDEGKLTAETPGFTNIVRTYGIRLGKKTEPAATSAPVPTAPPKPTAPAPPKPTAPRAQPSTRRRPGAGQGKQYAETEMDIAAARRAEAAASAPTGGFVGSTSDFKQEKIKDLLDLIAEHESGGDYNAMNQGTLRNKIVGSRVSDDGKSDTDGVKKHLGKLLTEMTVGEVMKLQQTTDTSFKDETGKPTGTKMLFAAGKYQIIPNTLKEAVDKKYVKRTDMFDETTQEKLGIYLATTKRPRLGKYLKGDPSVSFNEAAADLALEWASIPVANPEVEKMAEDAIIRQYPNISEEGKKKIRERIKVGGSAYGSGNKADPGRAAEVGRVLTSARGSLEPAPERVAAATINDGARENASLSQQQAAATTAAVVALQPINNTVMMPQNQTSMNPLASSMREVRDSDATNVFINRNDFIAPAGFA